MKRYFLYIFDESSKANINIKPIDKKYEIFEFKPSLLKLKLTKFTDDKFYMIVEENNISSQKGIIKSGFKKFEEVYKDKLGIYRKVIS